MARRLRPATRRASAALALAAVLAVAGCGSNSSTAEPQAPPTSAATTPPPDPGPVKVTVQNAQDLNKRPFITVNRGALPTQLQTTDLIVGTGRTAVPTDTVTVQYVGAIARNGQEFDASWDKGQPATFPLDQVIPGFRDGIAGMKVGGRRQIIMPPDQAYGSQGSGSAIGPDETLIFVVDLISIA
jgi:peptidylprolyl isomerase